MLYQAKRRRQKELFCWLFVAPTLVLFLMFTALPIFSSFYYAMHDWSGLGPVDNFTGLQNFVEVVRDPYFWNAYGNSFVFMLGSVPIHVFVGLFLAMALNDKTMKFVKGYRAMFFLPVVTTAAIVGIVMIFVLAANGPLNSFLQFVSLIDAPVNWLGDPSKAMGTAIVVIAWKYLGMNMIYWLAALQSIPEELYEAGRIDGCGKPQLFFYITAPVIAPIGAIIALLNIVESLKAFDMIKTLTNGGPFFATDVISTYIYRYAFTSEQGLPRMGYSAAAGIFFGITVILVGLVSNTVKNRIDRRLV